MKLPLSSSWVWWLQQDVVAATECKRKSSRFLAFSCHHTSLPLSHRSSFETMVFKHYVNQSHCIKIAYPDKSKICYRFVINLLSRVSSSKHEAYMLQYTRRAVHFNATSAYG